MWQTLESDPGLFTELVEKWGVKNVEFNELFSVDAASFEMLESDKIYGVIFLFNHSQQPRTATEPTYDYEAPVFFANQVVENSCASQALLGLVLSQGDDLEVSDELKNLRDFCTAVDFEMRGEIVGSSEYLQKSHNSMCSPPSFIEDGDSPREREAPDAFHYIVYLPLNNHIYELDGLKKAPIDHGPYEGPVGSALSRVVNQRIAEFGDDQLGFSVMVATNDLRTSHASDLQWQAAQQQKREKWHRENELRRFQFTGLAAALLKQIISNEAQSD